MSERTTIGGTVYESIGSSSSNLLLKCNGTARIQWGNKLIDLIKNGKIASGDASSEVSIVSDESDIKADGIYIINKDDKFQLWISKHGKHYNLTGVDLYISASTKQDITVEQQQQALENIGLYYETFDDVEKAGIQNGLVYVISEKCLYTIRDGVISEFEAKLKTVTVEQENEEGEIIKSSFRIVLSVANKDYLVLENNKINANCDINVANHAKVMSDGADDTRGFRLFMDGDVARLDVDQINVRDGLPISHYTEVTFTQLTTHMKSGTLVPLEWYLITDFQNHWKMVKKNSLYRPILVRAVTKKLLYEWGFLFKDHSVSIKYDPYYQDNIKIDSESTVSAKGKILWMRDSNNNQANFDFLDYRDSDNKPLATLHASRSQLDLDRSIFPVGSHDNTIVVDSLWGTVLVNGTINNANAYKVDFQFVDSPDEEDTSDVVDTTVYPTMEMYNNTLHCKGLIVTSECTKLCNNKFGLITNLTLSSDVENSIFGDVYECDLNCNFNNVKFKNLEYCTFNGSLLNDVICRTDVAQYDFNSTVDVILFDSSLYKEIYFKNGRIYHIGGDDGWIPRGLIAMHSGLEEIPTGWAPCDGGTYYYNGVSVQTPNLVDRFIKGVGKDGPIGAVDNYENNSLTLTTDYLPSHSHPQSEHTHSFSGSTSKTLLTSATTKEAIVSVEDGTSGYSGDETTSQNVTINVSGTTGASTSSESEWQYKTTPDAIKIEPNYYTLIFIMKL